MRRIVGWGRNRNLWTLILFLACLIAGVYSGNAFAQERITFPWEYSAEGQFEKGLSLLDEGNPSEAVTHFTKAIQIKGDFLDAYILRGIVWGEHLGNYPNALKDFDKVLQLEPNNATVYALRGATHVKMGMTEQALADYDRTLELDPNNPNAHFNRGQVWKVKGDLDKAIEDTRAAIAADSENQDYHKALADLELLKAQSQTATKGNEKASSCFIGSLAAD